MCSNFPEFHCHTQSLDSASTLDNFAKREVELGTGYLTSTDHGTLQATRLVYDLCHGKYKNNLKPVLGCEVYFRDDACPIMTTAGIPKGADGTFRDTFKYGHLTVHCLDEAAYSTLSIVMSDADLRAETHGSERKPLLDWSMLARLGEQNMTCGSGCLISAINRHLLRGDWESAKKYYEQVRGLFKPGNFYAEVFPHICDRNWESKVDIIDPKGVVTPFRTWKKIKLANGDTMSAEELAHELAKHPEATKNYLAVVEVMDARAWKMLERPIELATCTLKEGWVINECTPHTPNGDWQFRANQFILDMAHKYGDPVVISGDAHFAYEKEKIVQDVRLAQSGSWRMSTSYHRRSSSDAWKHFESVGVVRKEFDGWVQNNIEWASRFDGFKFSPKQPLPTKFYPKDTLKHTLKLVHDHGRMDWNNPEMVSRLETEIQLLHKNGTVDLLPYFMVDEEVCSEYAKRGELTGPGRGSAAGVLLAYLLGITHVNPLRYKLSLDRFLTLDRIQTGKFPDIDQDLTSRDILVGPNEEGGWLQERFGDCVAQISIDTTIRLKNAIKDTFRAAERMTGNQNPRVPPEIEAFCKTLPIPPQGISDHDFVFGYQDDSGAQIPGLIETHAGLQRFSKKYPEHWETIQMVLGLSRQKSRHACAFVINSEPISSFIPLQTVGGVRCTSFTAPAVEAAGGLKMDFLVVNNLKDIQKAIKLIQQRHKVNCEIVDGFGRINGIPTPACRIVPLGDQVFDIYDLPSCESVYKDICDGRVETVFQFDAPAARMGFSNFRASGDVLPLSSIDDLAVFTALDRPGPLNTDVVDEHGNAHNMLVEFSRRAKGLPKVGAIDVLDAMLPETKGVCCFQESCQEVFHKVGQTTAIEANNFRYRFSKKKMVECDKKDRPIFMKGAVPLVGQEKADKIWNTLYSFAGYAFNKSHAVCYVVISYACAWLKHNYPLEWWSAVLSNATRKEIDEKFWGYCGQMILLPDIQRSKKDFTVEEDKIRAPLSLLHGLGDKAHQQLLEGAPYSSIKGLLEHIQKWRVDNAKPVQKVDKKTGETKTVLKKAVSAVNTTVIQRLIVSGVMDSLFQPSESGTPLTVHEKLAEFSFALREVTGNKKFNALSSKYNLDSPVVLFQVRKSILPAYSEPLARLVQKITPWRFKGKDALTFYGGNTEDTVGEVRERWRVISGRQYEALQQVPPLSASMNVAMVGYVVTERRFEYTQKTTGDKKVACELTLDVEGTHVAVVKWPSKDGLPPSFNKKMTGAIVVAFFVRGEGRQDFFFAELVTVAPPLGTEEENDESEEASK